MARLILLCSINLSSYMSCCIFKGRLAPWTTDVFGQSGLSWEVPATVVALFFQTWQGDKWQVDLVPHEAQYISYCWSLCISKMWLLYFFLVERIMKQELQGKETSGKRDQGGFDHHALLHPQAVLHILLIPPLILHLLLPPPSSSSFFSSSSSSLSFSFRRFGRPQGPPFSPSRTCRTDPGVSAYNPGLLLSKGSKKLIDFKLFTSYKIVTGITTL